MNATLSASAGALALAALAASPDAGRAAETLKLGFYAHFAPMSYSADRNPDSAGFDEHRGYEADLLTALEAMTGGRLAFERRAIAEWPGIWLKPAGKEFDVVGGGITILESRTRDASGKAAVAFTNGHVAFRQSLLVRAAEAERLARHDALGSDVRVGVVGGTTGEARLLRLTGLAGPGGVLAAGARIETVRGEALADGSPAYKIAARGATPNLEGRRRLHPPDDTKPQVIYSRTGAGETELLEALRRGDIDAVARGEIGNLDAARESGGAFAVTALDDEVEWGGFAVAAGSRALLAALNEKIDWLTDGRRVGYAEWLADPGVFLRRAEEWRRGRAGK